MSRKAWDHAAIQAQPSFLQKKDCLGASLRESLTRKLVSTEYSGRAMPADKLKIFMSMIALTWNGGSIYLPQTVSSALHQNSSSSLLDTVCVACMYSACWTSKSRFPCTRLPRAHTGLPAASILFKLLPGVHTRSSSKVG